MIALGQRLRAWALNWKSHLGTVLLVMVVVGVVQLWQTRNATTGPLPAAALDMALPVLDTDGRVRTSSLRDELQALQQAHPGRNVGLYLWAEWCPICKTMRVTINGLAQDHPVLTVAMQSGPAEQVVRHLRAGQLPWHTLVDPRGQLSAQFGLGAVPGFVVVTPSGQLRWPTVGYSSGWGLRLRLWLAR